MCDSAFAAPFLGLEEVQPSEKKSPPHNRAQTRTSDSTGFKLWVLPYDLVYALYVLVFLTRYLDLFFRYVSVYNTVMKIFFIASSAYILYLMKIKYRPTNDPSIDTFKVEYLVAPCLILALLFHYSFTFTEILWSFSIWVEAVAILPQLFMLQRTGEAETITTHYLAALGAYRALYIPNWIYSNETVITPVPWYFTEGLVDPIAVTAGIVQTGLYLDFFYVYFTKVLQGQKFELPA
ncbi:hypothetical protein CVT24_008983 [Panaeolus cyanescens]|uniref:ER lumen protein-retaining receptor n=1 Tax=Panaeolus cyanescens TaxID=181874 RepID=A0A409YAQ8_9AGAR|nr:hypothetical protein CVT24_008983 [Panaeolus cyanescens]